MKREGRRAEKDYQWKCNSEGALAASFSHKLHFRSSKEAGDTCTTYEITKKIFAVWSFWKGCFCEMGSWLKGNCLLRHRVLIRNMTRGDQQYWAQGCHMICSLQPVPKTCWAWWLLSLSRLHCLLKPCFLNLADSPPSRGLRVEHTPSQNWPFS